MSVAQPRSSGIPHPWGSPYTCREQSSFFNTKTSNNNPKGTGTRRQLSLCTDTADASKLQHQPSSLPRAGETQNYPPQLAHTFSRIKQSTSFSSSIRSPAQHGHLQLRGESPRRAGARGRVGWVSTARTCQSLRRSLPQHWFACRVKPSIQREPKTPALLKEKSPLEPAHCLQRTIY